MKIKSNERNTTHNEMKNQSIQKRLLKEMSSKENEIIKLSDIGRTLREDKALVQEKLSYAEKQIIICMNRIRELDYKVDELNDEIEKKNGTIKCLTDSKLELEQFINETRSANMRTADLNGSMECFDSSFVRNIGNTNTSSNVSSPENLGASVVDVQLREKEHENSKLKEDLKLFKNVHKCLAKNLQDLVEKQTKEFAIVIEKDIFVEKSNQNPKHSVQDDPLEEFNLFSSCMDKISIYHKSEREKKKELEMEKQKLLEVNETLTINIDTLLNEVKVLKEIVFTEEEKNQKLLVVQQEIKEKMRQSQLELDQLKSQKQEFYIELQNSFLQNDSLSKELETMLRQNETSQKYLADLKISNTLLKKDIDNLNNKYKNLEQQFALKTKELESVLNNRNEKISVQMKEITSYKFKEEQMNDLNEQHIITNEELRKQLHRTDNHMNDMQRLLSEKQEKISNLEHEMTDITQKNIKLKEKIDCSMKVQHQENVTHANAVSSYQQEIKALLEKSNSLQLSLQQMNKAVANKTQENEEIQKMLHKLISKLANILKLFDMVVIQEDALQNVAELDGLVKKLLQQKSVTNTKIDALERDQNISTDRIQELLKNLNEKKKSIAEYKESCKELLTLRRQNIEYKDNIEKLKEQQDQFVVKVKTDLIKKEKELKVQLQQTSEEYEASLECIRVELKTANEYHNNKERELMLVIAQHNDVKMQLFELQHENEKLHKANAALQEQNNKLKVYESLMSERYQENKQLQQDIEGFKQQVHANASRLLQADIELTTLLDMAKEHELSKQEVQHLRETLKQKEHALQSQLQLRHDIKQQLDEQFEKVIQLSGTIKKLELNRQELLLQLQNEQKEKAMLLHSFEKSTDQWRATLEEKDRQSLSLEQKYNDTKQQLSDLTVQNTKIHGDLVERDAELRMSLEDYELDRDQFQQKLSQLKLKLSESSEQFEKFNIALMEILTILDNNFNLSREMRQEEVKNIFNARTSSDDETMEDIKLNKLRMSLNRLFHLDIQMQSQFKELMLKQNETSSSLKAAQNDIDSMQTKLKQQNKDIMELRVQVENENLIAHKRVSQEIIRLEGDLLNLEKVNERLVNGNFEMQVSMGSLEQDLTNAKSKLTKLEEEKLMLKEEICTKSKLLEKLQKEDHRLEQLYREKKEKSEEILKKCVLLETQLKESTIKIESLSKGNQDSKLRCQHQQQTIDQQHQRIQNQQLEYNKLKEKCKQLQTTNDYMETELSTKNKELLSLNNKKSDLLQSLKNTEQQLESTTVKLDEAEGLKINNETQCQQIHSQYQQLQRDIDFLRAQHQFSLEENQRLTKEIDSLKQDKLHLREETRDTKSDLQRANDNVTQLIQQISAIRLEKEAISEESQLIRNQLEESGKHHSNSETKLRTIVEKSQDFERKLLIAENELKSVKSNLEKSNINVEKLSAENNKLKDSQENSTRRIEKLALKLGDSQARSTKLDRDNEKLLKTIEANVITVEALQKEKDLLQKEAKTLKERLSRAERVQEQLAAKVQNLEYSNSQLQDTKQKLEASEIDGKSKLIKLEKVRDSYEEKIHKLSNSLDNAEHTNVKLHLEIGALNSQLHELHALNTPKEGQDFPHKLQIAQEGSKQYEELCLQLQVEVDHLRDEKTTLCDKLSKETLNLQITKEHCERLCFEIEQMRADLSLMRTEKSQAEMINQAATRTLHDLQTKHIRTENLLDERKTAVISLETRVSFLEDQLASKCTQVNSLQQENQNVHDSAYTALAIQQAAINETSEIAELRMKLSAADQALKDDQQVIAQLKLDNQILHTKYQESKQNAIDAVKNGEERIKENRLELEGKLEKMKNKMKTLYTEEITKMKTKQEREVAAIKSEMEVTQAQDVKYEEHIRKLSTQIVRLNDNILEHQKENAIISTQLKHLLEQQDSETFKRPNSIHVSAVSSSTTPSTVATKNIGTNLAMEDEEGEVFNNTYLTDLKAGRISDFMSREVCAEELKYRNSLLPPHLRSTYAAQFDHEFTEDELKDGPHGLDDSMSALLSTTAGGSRKKCTGMTHYKRPGPPTPSKNGRLSFGGISEPMREILKESFDGNTTSSVSSSRTPARFNFFASRFSMGNGKDEKSNSKLDSDKVIPEEVAHNKPLAKTLSQRLLSGAICTSTPRKSKLHYDQRRILDSFLISSPSPSPLAAEPRKIVLPVISLVETPPDVSLIKAPMHKQNENPLDVIANCSENLRRSSSMYGQRLSRRLQAIHSPTSGDTTSSAFSNTPKNKVSGRQTISSLTTTSGVMTSKTVILQKRLRKKNQRERGGRPSLNIRCNFFAKHRTPNRGAQHDLNKYKSRKQRLDLFNRGRNLQMRHTDSVEDQNMLDKVIYDLTNNNYATFNHNNPAETILQKNTKRFTKEQVETFVCDSEMFITHDTKDLFKNVDDIDYGNYNYDTDNNSEVDEKDFKYNVPFKMESCKQELVMYSDLDQFDSYSSGLAKQKTELSCDSNGSSTHFEKLLIETESNAPFDIKSIEFNNENETSQYTINQGPNVQQSDVVTARLQISPNNASENLSRIIYGGTVIYNRRLPNINTTYVRKSSIYVKNKNQTVSDSTTNNDVILITNQTITVADLVRMWRQMDASARMIVSFAALASVTTILGLLISFCSNG